jgi:hypothetical protein
MAIQRRGLLWESTVDLTAAQIKTWHSAPIEAAPAPGANRIIAPLRYALLMAPGTVGFSAVQGAAVELDLTCNGVTLDSYSGVQNVLGQTTAKGSLFAASTNQAVTLATLSNQALTATLDRDLTAGGVATATLNAAGLGYAANDTGTIDPNNNGSATYRVLTVGALGVVATFSITAAGNGYVVANGLDTDASGGGTGFKVNVTGITQGNGTLRLITRYATPTLS